MRRHAARGLELIDRTQQAVGSLDLQVSAAMRGSGLITTGLSSAVRSGRHDVIFDWAERARLRHSRSSRCALRPTRSWRLISPSCGSCAPPSRTETGSRHPEPRCCGIGRASANGRTRVPEQRTPEPRSATCGRASASDDVLLSYIFDGMRLAVARRIPDAGRVRRAGLEGCQIGSQRPPCRPRRVGQGDDRTDGSRRAGRARRSTDRVVDRPGCPDQAIPEQPTAGSCSPPRACLSGMPWMMLPGLRARVLTVAPSASRWMRDRGQGWDHRRKRRASSAGPRVERGDEEVEAAASAWSAPTILRGAARRRWRTSSTSASSVDVLHVAPMGGTPSDNPLFSGLELADGSLFGYDIDLDAARAGHGGAVGLRGGSLVGAVG